MDIADKIKKSIQNAVQRAETDTRYRTPLVGFASAVDPLFDKMKANIGEHILHPRDLLPEAKTVVAFFLPFDKSIVKSNRQGVETSREWAVAYIETNRLIGEICAKLKEELASKGIKAVAEKATHNFNEDDLTAGWSHKSAAFVAGLGSFGINRMLITPSGCAGRFGSIIISEEILPTTRPTGNFCRYHKDGKCLYCVNNCPTMALKVDSLDKKRCYQHLLENDARFPDLGLCDVCGKCAVGPCAILEYSGD